MSSTFEHYGRPAGQMPDRNATSDARDQRMGQPAGQMPDRKARDFEALVQDLRRQEPAADLPDSAPVEVTLPRVLVQLAPGETGAPAPATVRSADMTAIADRIGIEIRSAIEAHPRMISEGQNLRIDLGRNQLGLQSLSIEFSGTTLVLRVSAEQAHVQGIHQVLQGLALALAQRHPTRSIRIEEEPMAPADENAFDPLRMPVQRP